MTGRGTFSEPDLWDPPLPEECQECKEASKNLKDTVRPMCAQRSTACLPDSSLLSVFSGLTR